MKKILRLTTLILCTAISAAPLMAAEDEIEICSTMLDKANGRICTEIARRLQENNLIGWSLNYEARKANYQTVSQLLNILGTSDEDKASINHALGAATENPENQPEHYRQFLSKSDLATDQQLTVLLLLKQATEEGVMCALSIANIQNNQHVFEIVSRAKSGAEYKDLVIYSLTQGASRGNLPAVKFLLLEAKENYLMDSNPINVSEALKAATDNNHSEVVKYMENLNSMNFLGGNECRGFIRFVTGKKTRQDLSTTILQFLATEVFLSKPKDKTAT